MGKSVKKVVSIATGGLYKPSSSSGGSSFINNSEVKDVVTAPLEKIQQQQQQDQQENRERQKEADADALVQETGKGDELGGVLTSADGIVGKKKLTAKTMLGG